LISAGTLSETLHKIEVFDKAGNSSNLSFIVDKTNPIITIKKSGYAVEPGAHFKTNTSVSIVSNDTNKDIVYFDNLETTANFWNASDLFEGVHVYTVYDKAGNFATIEIICDKTSPIINLNNTINEDGKTYYSNNDSVKIQIVETYEYTIKLNQEEITELDFIASLFDDGIYLITVEDKAGNITTCNFVIDKTDPYIAVKNGNQGEFLTENLFASANAILQISFVDTNKDYWTLDGQITTTMPTANTLDDGLHTIKAYDKAGNCSVATFVIDKIAPQLNIIDKSTSSDGKYYYNESENISISYDDTNIDYVCLDNQQIDITLISAGTLSETLHKIEVFDKAGNSSNLSFIVDKTDPYIELKRNGLTISSSDEFFKADQIVSIFTSDSNGVLLVELDGELTVFKSWNISTFADGIHIISIYDFAENKSQVSFIVDNTLPYLEMSLYYKSGDEIVINVIEANKYIVRLDNTQIETTSLLATSLEESEHILTVTDQAGNVIEKKFIVDLTNPILLTYKNSKLLVDNELFDIYIKAGDTISIYVEDVNLDTVLFDSEGVSVRLWQADALDERSHTILVSDIAGNLSSVSFIVDKTQPEVAFQKYYIEGQSIILDIIDSNPVVVLINNIDILSERVLSVDDFTEGKHLVEITDKAGNKTQKEFMSLVKINNLLKKHPRLTRTANSKFFIFSN
jgi:hypothetical protein